MDVDNLPPELKSLITCDGKELVALPKKGAHPIYYCMTSRMTRRFGTLNEYYFIMDNCFVKLSWFVDPDSSEPNTFCLDHFQCFLKGVKGRGRHLLYYALTWLVDNTEIDKTTILTLTPDALLSPGKVSTYPTINAAQTSLIQYYTTYGFQRVPSRPTNIVRMQATVDDIITSCNNYYSDKFHSQKQRSFKAKQNSMNRALGGYTRKYKKHRKQKT